MARTWTQAVALVLLLAGTALAGCIGGQTGADDELDPNAADASDYEVPEPVDVAIVEEDHFIEMPDGVEIHARVLKPDIGEKVPVVAEYTIYNAAGEPTFVDHDTKADLGLALPDTYTRELVRRGFAFAYVDTRGSSGSEGCGDLRGQQDIDDAYHITAYLSQLEYANGKVAFIGASYPGSMAHIAGIANGPGLAAVVPVVASTSFYHYHHNGGVPYSNTATNVLYSVFNVAPNANPQHPTAATRTADDATCPYPDDILQGFTKDGHMNDWWAQRNLRPLVGNVEVPILMAQGLGDWNVKPDHVGHYFNDLTAPKKMVLGQHGHQFPPGDDNPFGTWWELVTRFLDQHLRGLETGVMDGPAVWVQDAAGTWRGEGAWPPTNTTPVAFYLGAGALTGDVPAEASVSFTTRPLVDDNLGFVEAVGTETVTYESAPLTEALHYAGAPTLTLTVGADRPGHIVAELYEVDPSGTWTRENYGYLNLAYRNGIEAAPAPMDGIEQVTLEMYPQDDVFEAGNRLVLVLAGTDEGATVPPRYDWTVTVHEGAGSVLELPVRAVGDDA